MSKNYTPSSTAGKRISNGAQALLATCLIFAILPAMHIMGNIQGVGNKVTTEELGLLPPPSPIEEPPAPELEEDLEKPELKQPVPPLTPEQIEIIINLKPSGSTGIYSIGLDNANIDLEGEVGTFDISELDEPPKPIFQITPNYPYAMQQAHIDGWVDLEWIIDPRGSVIKAWAVKSSHREFEKPAIESVMRSKWKPGKKDGKAVATKVRQRMLFNTD